MIESYLHGMAPITNYPNYPNYPNYHQLLPITTNYQLKELEEQYFYFAPLEFVNFRISSVRW